MRDFLPAVYASGGISDQYYDRYEPWVNCIPVPLKNNEFGVVPRDELSKDADFTASSANNRGRGVFVFASGDKAYLDEDLFYINGGGSQSLSDTSAPGYAGNTGFNEEYGASFVEHKVSGVPNMVIVNAGHTSTHASAKHGTVWYTPNSATVPVGISDANIPGNNGVSLIRGGASLDGYFFVGDITGKIHNSNINDLTTWTSTDFLTAERYPDNGVYLGRHQDNIVWIGTRSIEFFYNAANASGSPLARRQDVSYSVGCVFPNSVYQEGDVIYFVGNTPDGTIGVYRIVNFTLEKISDINVENRFRSQSAASSIPYDITDLDSLNHRMWLSGGVLNSTPGLFVTWDSYFTFFYCKSSGLWTRVSYDDTVTYPGGTSGNWSNTLPISGYDGIQTSSGVSQMQLINGTLVDLGTVDNDAINDLGSANAPDVFLNFHTWDAGTNKKKRINSVRVITEAIASDSSTADPLTVNLQWFDTDKTFAIAGGDPFNSGRSTDLNIRSPKLARLGVTRARRFRLNYATGHGNTNYVKGLEIDYDVVE